MRFGGFDKGSYIITDKAKATMALEIGYLNVVKITYVMRRGNVTRFLLYLVICFSFRYLLQVG